MLLPLLSLVSTLLTFGAIGGVSDSWSNPLSSLRGVIRADGPSLGLAPFNVPGALANPVLTLYTQDGLPIASNTGWGNAPTSGSGATSQMVIQPLTAASLSAKVGAFAIPAGSADSAMVVTLPPGNYTAEVSGLNNTTGIALVEIYELR